jgi:3' terminal RNA ribose 2'-O-methyltransferase Hen1
MVPNLVLSPSFVTEPPPPKPVVEKGPKKPSLHHLRHIAVHEALRESGARTVLDLGCGGWLLLERLAADPQFVRFLGVEMLDSQLDHAVKRGVQKSVDSDIRIEAIKGSVIEFDPRMSGFDAAAMVEVIEHLPPETLPQLAQTLFGQARPRTVVMTTPNVECNRFVEGLAPGRFREPTHKFEWTRAEFQAWCNAAARDYGYDVEYGGIGEEREDCGTMTQMATFTRLDSGADAA